MKLEDFKKARALVNRILTSRRTIEKLNEVVAYNLTPMVKKNVGLLEHWEALGYGILIKGKPDEHLMSLVEKMLHDDMQELSDLGVDPTPEELDAISEDRFGHF